MKARPLGGDQVRTGARPPPTPRGAAHSLRGGRAGRGHTGARAGGRGGGGGLAGVCRAARGGRVDPKVSRARATAPLRPAAPKQCCARGRGGRRPKAQAAAAAQRGRCSISISPAQPAGRPGEPQTAGRAADSPALGVVCCHGCGQRVKGPKERPGGYAAVAVLCGQSPSSGPPQINPEHETRYGTWQMETWEGGAPPRDPQITPLEHETRCSKWHMETWGGGGRGAARRARGPTTPPRALPPI
jgi:hypothetical protein